MAIDIIGTWCIGVPLCLIAAYVFKWGIAGFRQRGERCLAEQISPVLYSNAPVRCLSTMLMTMGT